MTARIRTRQRSAGNHIRQFLKRAAGWNRAASSGDVRFDIREYALVLTQYSPMSEPARDIFGWIQCWGAKGRDFPTAYFYLIPSGQQREPYLGDGCVVAH